MKKCYMFLAIAFFGAVANAQPDLSLSLNNYSPGEATSDDPLDMVFTITNEGTTPIPAGDTIFCAFLLGSSTYAPWGLSYGPGYFSYYVLNADLPAGSSFDYAMFPSPMATLSMEWIYDEMNALTGNICSLVGVGIAGASQDPGGDANYLDNTMCISYTVTSVAGIEESDKSAIQVYPNPAADVVNFQFGNTQVSHLNIFDLNGKLVQTIQVNGSLETISTENIGDGVFYYQLMNGETLVATDKFVVTK